jgi:hypothetical protein
VTTQNGPGSAATQTTGPQKSAATKPLASGDHVTGFMLRGRPIDADAFGHPGQQSAALGVYSVSRRSVPCTRLIALAKVREGAALRRESLLLGECPRCAAPVLADCDEVRVRHRPGCPAGTETLARSLGTLEAVQAVAGGL